MKICVVLPTSNTEDITHRQNAYQRLAQADTEISVRTLDKRAPPEADPSDSFILPEILRQVVAANDTGMDAVIIDCMEDPGVEEARRLVDIPVIGPGQEAMRLAAILGCRFSILYPLRQTVLIERLVKQRQLTSMLASIRHIPGGMDGIHSSPETTLERLVVTAIAAIREDGAHVIVPACTLLSDITEKLQEQLHELGFMAPVVDGPSAAIKLAESLSDLGLSPSRISYPPALGISRPI